MSRGFFGTGEPGPCPICGAPNTTCVGDGGDVPRNVVRVYEPAAGEKDTARFRSVQQVWEDHRLKYGIGTEIPLIEALRQGQVRPKDLTEDDKVQLRQHVAKGLISLAVLKAFLIGPPADKMMRTGDIVTK